MDLDSYTEKLTRHRPLPKFSGLEGKLHRFSPGERLVLYILTALLAGSTFILLAGANAAVSVDVPAVGGSLTEGVVGPARFINPLLTLSEPDADLSALVYSGLMRALPDGSLIPDLAESYDISEDGTTYTFTLRANATFHDGSAVTSADVVFTVQKAQNPDIKSQHRADWEGVAVSAPDKQTVVFKLPHPYAPFLENTTLGILPQHLWQNISAEEFPFSPLNTHPVGSGPYRIAGLATDATGSATRYTLASFKQFTLGEPYLKKISFLFYPNEEGLVAAYNSGYIDSFAGITPSEVSELKADTSIVRTVLPRTFGIFFNQNKNTALADASARDALNAAVDKQALVNEVLRGYGATLEGPIPPGLLGANVAAVPAPLEKHSTFASSTPNAETARTILLRGGWKFDDAAGAWKKGKNTLSFTLATADEPELSHTAEILAASWRAAGIPVDVHVYSLSELNSTIIRPRAYDAVLFGEVVGRTLDLFAFWHSSQRNDPGLNLALYANVKVDALLSDARATTDGKEREKLYTQFASLVQKDAPAVFLYAPDFLYVVPPKLHGAALGALTSPAERFANVYQWYTETERVWNIFSDKTN